MAYWNSSETSITLSGLKRNGMSRSNVRGLVAFCKVFRSDRLTNLIPGYTTRSVCCTLSPPSSRLPPICRCFPFSPLVCSASPLLFSLFFSSPFFALACAFEGISRLEKPTENKGRDDAWDPLLLPSSSSSSPSIALFDCSLASVTRDETRRDEVSRYK